MEKKLAELESKINLLINSYTHLKNENTLLKEQLFEKENKITDLEGKRDKVINKIDNLIEVLRKEGIFEESS